MGSDAQRKATHQHRERQKRKGVRRVEVQVPEQDAQSIRLLAKLLRTGDPEAMARVRSILTEVLGSTRDLPNCKALLTAMPEDIVLERLREFPSDARREVDFDVDPSLDTGPS